MEQCGFFDANLVGEEYDRVYLAKSFAAYFASFIGNGIFGGKLSELQVLPDDGMSIAVLSGQGWINGYWYENTDKLSLEISNADGTLNRIDSVVLRWGNKERSMWLQVNKGAYATTPVAPELTRNADYYELQLATVYVKAGATKVESVDITDTRLDSNVCGLVTGLISQLDATTLGEQLNGFIDSYISDANTDYSKYKAKLLDIQQSYQHDVDEMLKQLQDLLDTDVIGQINNNIGTLALLTTTTKTSLVDAVNEVNAYRNGINLCKKDYYECNTIPYESADKKVEIVSDDTRFSKRYFKLTWLKSKSTSVKKGAFFRFRPITNDVKKGDAVTISFYIKCSREVAFSVLGVESVAAVTIAAVTNRTIGTEWQKIEMTSASFPHDALTSITLVLYSPSTEILEEGLEYYISDIKYEKGNKATDWTPAPEDLLPVDGNAVSASKLQTARNIALTGAVSGNVNFDGSGDVSIATTMQNGTIISSGSDWNTLTTEGTYKIQCADMDSDHNAPVNEYNYGVLVVFRVYHIGEPRGVQLYFPHQNYKYPLWIRVGNGTDAGMGWKDWVGLKNYDSIIGTLSNLGTTEKGSLVGAINEVRNKVVKISSANSTSISTISQSGYMSSGTIKYVKINGFCTVFFDKFYCFSTSGSLGGVTLVNSSLPTPVAGFKINDEITVSSSGKLIGGDDAGGSITFTGTVTYPLYSSL